MTNPIPANRKYEHPDPMDGYHVERTINETELGRLELVHRLEKKETQRRRLKYEAAAPPGDTDGDIEAQARLQRDELLAEAFCRYFNSGGSMEEIRLIGEAVLSNFISIHGNKESFPLLPLPWRLLLTREQSQREYVFFEPQTGQAVQWIEGKRITKTTLEALSQSHVLAENKVSQVTPHVGTVDSPNPSP